MGFEKLRKNILNNYNIQSMIHLGSKAFEEISGEVIDLVDGVAFYNEGQLTMMKSGILCKLYSEDLSKEEMVSVISSMQTSSLK